MREYLFCVFAAALFCGLASMMSVGGSFEKYIKYICALLCIVTVISPFIKIKINPDEFELPKPASETSVDTAVVAEIAEKNAKEYISSLLFSKFGINASDVRIKISSSNNLTLETVTVFIERGTADSLDVKTHLESVLGGTITVEYTK
ncbi:MAG: hypothetical protein RR246_04975 [Clostridia bacterium]